MYKKAVTANYQIYNTMFQTYRFFLIKKRSFILEPFLFRLLKLILLQFKEKKLKYQ